MYINIKKYLNYITCNNKFKNNRKKYNKKNKNKNISRMNLFHI